MAKTEVYSWRLSRDLKTELEEAARAASKNVAQLLEEIAEEWLAHQRAQSTSQDERQRNIREAAMRSVGAIRGNDPNRAENARSAIVVALTEYNRRKRLQILVQKFGTLDGFMTQEELLELREDS